MSRKKLIARDKAPSEEVARLYSERDFLILEDVCKLSGVGKDTTELMLKQSGLKPFILETKDATPINGYLTIQVKKILASRGRIIPGFNEDYASQRQWMEILESAIKKPLEKDWYFQPVNPDPLVRMDNERAEFILSKVREGLDINDEPCEILKLIADYINTYSRDDMPLRPNSHLRGAGSPFLFGLRSRK